MATDRLPLYEQVWRCQHCNRRWKGITVEVYVGGVLVQPRCPHCGGNMRWVDMAER